MYDLLYLWGMGNKIVVIRCGYGGPFLLKFINTHGDISKIKIGADIFGKTPLNVPIESLVYVCVPKRRGFVCIFLTRKLTSLCTVS